MIPSSVSVRELIGWDLDEYHFRNAAVTDAQNFSERIARAKHYLAGRCSYEASDALLERETESISELLSVHEHRPELLEEYAGLEWGLGVVDLRRLIAFQRRLILDAEAAAHQILNQNDWHGLVSLAFEAQRRTDYTIALNRKGDGYLDVSLHSQNPDLQLRLSSHTGKLLPPFTVYAGSPFFEVAEFRGRWFLRDGYHRAFSLLRAGVCLIPAVVIHARLIDEVGAIQPWFFKEEQLFSKTPPLVTDFLQQDLAIDYPRQRLIKTIRVRIEESLQPMEEICNRTGDDL